MICSQILRLFKSEPVKSTVYQFGSLINKQSAGGKDSISFSVGAEHFLENEAFLIK